MSTVPYIFANDYGNIPLSYLDANFANVKASVDFAVLANTANLATTAITATTAGTVTTAAQPNITSVGTLTSLTVSGTVTTGNITTSNATISGTLVAANANITNALSASTINAVEIVGDLKGSVYADDSTIIVDAIDNRVTADTAIFGTTTISGNVSIGERTTLGGLEIVTPNFLAFTTNSNVVLSNTTSYNMLYGNVSGLTVTVDMPIDPVEGQLTRMAINGNAITLALGNGNVSVDFSGLNQPGNTYKYLYSTSTQRWVRTS